MAPESMFLTAPLRWVTTRGDADSLQGSILVYFRYPVCITASPFLVLERPFPVIKTQKTRFVIWLQKKKKSLWVYWIFKNLLATPCSLWDLMQELNPCRLHWTHEVLTTGPPGRFLLDFLKPFLHVCMLSCQNGVQLFTTLWTVAHQAPLSMGFSRQEHWSGLPGSPPGDLSNPGIKPTSLMSPALAAGFFTTNATWEAQAFLNYTQFYGLLNDIQVSMSR